MPVTAIIETTGDSREHLKNLAVMIRTEMVSRRKEGLTSSSQ